MDPCSSKASTVQKAAKDKRKITKKPSTRIDESSTISPEPLSEKKKKGYKKSTIAKAVIIEDEIFDDGIENSWESFDEDWVSTKPTNELEVEFSKNEPSNYSNTKISSTKSAESTTKFTPKPSTDTNKKGSRKSITAKAVVIENEINDDCVESTWESSDEEWVDIMPVKETKLECPETEPSINFIAKTKEMLARKTVEPGKRDLKLPVKSPIDLNRNEFWDEKFYKPHINEDLSSCFSQMSLDWESARKMFSSQSTISPLKNCLSDKNKTPSKVSLQNSKYDKLEIPHKLPLTEPKTPNRYSVAPSTSDPEVMKIFEKSLLISPLKQMVRPKDRPSRRISLIKLDDKVTVNFGKSPSPVTAREMGKKLFSGKHDWNVNAADEKENATPIITSVDEPEDVATTVYAAKTSKGPVSNKNKLDPAWAKGLDEIKSDYPFYSLKNAKVAENSGNSSIIVVGAEISTSHVEITTKDTNTAEKDVFANENTSEKREEEDPQIATTPKKGKVDDSHLFKTPTKSVRRLRKKSVSSDRISGGWSPGGKLSEHSCPYDPTESGCYSWTVEPQVPLNVPLAPSLDSIMKNKYEPLVKHGESTRIKEYAPELTYVDSASNDLSRSFEIEFETPIIDKFAKSPDRIIISASVKSILPKLLCHLESVKPNIQSIVKANDAEPFQEEKSSRKMKQTIHSGIFGSFANKTTEKHSPVPLNADENISVEMDSPSKCMKDVPSFIEAPVEETLDFEETASSPAVYKENVLIGYSEEFLDDGEILSSDDDNNETGLRRAQRFASCDSSSNSCHPVSSSSSNEKLDEMKNSNKNNEIKVHEKIENNIDSQLLADKKFLLKNKAKFTAQLSTNDNQKKASNENSNTNERNCITTQNTDKIKGSTIAASDEITDYLGRSFEIHKETNANAPHLDQPPRPTVQGDKFSTLTSVSYHQIKFTDKEITPSAPDSDKRVRKDTNNMSTGHLELAPENMPPTVQKTVDEILDQNETIGSRKNPSITCEEGLATKNGDISTSNISDINTELPSPSITETSAAAEMTARNPQSKNGADLATDSAPDKVQGTKTAKSEQSTQRTEHKSATIQNMISSIQDILRSDEALSNPSFADRGSNDQEFKDSGFLKTQASFKDKHPSANRNSSPGSTQVQTMHSLFTEEQLPNFTPPAPSMDILMREKTPLSSIVCPLQNKSVQIQPVLNKRISPSNICQDDEVPSVAETVHPADVNMLLASEESMSNWTPEPSPAEETLIDPLSASIGAKRRISLHDYVIMKENDINTSVLPDSSFCTPDFAKNKSMHSDLKQTPLAVELESNIFSKTIECTQSPIPVIQDAVTPTITDGSLSKKGLEPKLKYHHLIPIHIPPREFLYCKRVKMIQDMLINELISGIDFKHHQSSTHPLYTTRHNSSESTAVHGRVNTRSRVETMKSSESEEVTSLTNASIPEESQAIPPSVLPVVPNQSTVMQSNELSLTGKSIIDTAKPTASQICTQFLDEAPQQKSPRNSSQTTELETGQKKKDSPNSPNKALTSYLENAKETLHGTMPKSSAILSHQISSGMEDPSLNDEESHEYFKKVVIPKVMRVTDYIMSESSVISNYDCEPDSITVGKFLQQSVFDKSFDSLSNSNLETDTSGAKLFSPSSSSIAPSSFDHHQLPKKSTTPIASRAAPTSDHLVLAETTSTSGNVTESVKQCLLSDEGISRSPIFRGTDASCKEHTRGSDKCKDIGSTNTTDVPTDIIPATSAPDKEEITGAGNADVTNVDHQQYIDHPPEIISEVRSSCNLKAKAKLHTPSNELVNKDLVKPPKFKIPKKNKTLTATVGKTIQDDKTSNVMMMTSPSKIKQFVSSSENVMAPVGSTLFTQRKKKQLDVILSKERQIREQTLQEYNSKKQVESEKPSSPVEEVKDDTISATRKRRKTDSPEHSKSFDLRELLSRNSSSKPDSKRSRVKCSDEVTVIDQKPSTRSKEKARPEKPLSHQKSVQLDFKNCLFDALEAIKSKESDIIIPNLKARTHSSLSSWLKIWKADEATLKDLRTTRLQIRDPRYMPRDYSGLNFSDIPREQYLNTSRPAPEKSPPSHPKKVSKQTAGWEALKPNFSHTTVFPPQVSASTALEQSGTSQAITSKKNTNPLLTKKLTAAEKKCTASSKVIAPKVWEDCLKRANDAHRQYKRIRKQTVLDVMTSEYFSSFLLNVVD